MLVVLCDKFGLHLLLFLMPFLGLCLHVSCSTWIWKHKLLMLFEWFDVAVSPCTAEQKDCLCASQSRRVNVQLEHI